MTRQVPLRVQLTAWYGAILAVALALAACFAWFAMRANLYSAIDTDLRDRVSAAAADLEQELRLHGRRDLRAHLFEHAGGDAWQIRASDGSWLYRTPAATEHDTPLAILPRGHHAPVFSTVTIGRSSFRAAAAAADDDRGGTCTIQMLEPLDPVDNALAWFARAMTLASPLLLAGACAGGFWISSRALGPVDRITGAARAITAQRLSDRIPPTGSGDELQRLTETLNGMLDRLEQAFARVTQFTADASHELRTPVAFIRTTADVLLRRSRTGEQWRDGVLQIQGESVRMTELLDKLMTLARADAGVEPRAFEPLVLDGVVAAACRTALPLARLKGLELTHGNGDASVGITGDAVLLERLFGILLDNAVKYTPEGGRIAVAIECAPEPAVVIRDTGIGIPAVDLPNIFERFYRSDKTRSRDSGGSGLGLSIARWIVELHGGSISVSSDVNRGSEFRVRFPAAAA